MYFEPLLSPALSRRGGSGGERCGRPLGGGPRRPHEAPHPPPGGVPFEPTTGGAMRGSPQGSQAPIGGGRGHGMHAQVLGRGTRGGGRVLVLEPPVPKHRHRTTLLTPPCIPLEG